MAKSRIIPINAGFYNYKGLNNIIFPSLTQRLPYKGYETNNDIITFKGTSHIVGAGQPMTRLVKTTNETNKLLIFKMLSMLSQSEKETFKLMLTVPPLVYFKNEDDLFEEYSNYLLGIHDFEYNGIPKSFTIEDVQIVPETFVAYGSINAYGDYDNEDLYIIDIGGYTSTIARVNKGNFEGEDDFYTEQLGMYNIDQEISQMLNGKYAEKELKCNSLDIKTYREKGLFFDGDEDTNYFEKSKEDIDDIIIKHMNKLISSVQTKPWSLRAGKIVFTGGGGEIVYPIAYDKFFKNAKLSKNPLWDNLIGTSIVSNSVYLD